MRDILSELKRWRDEQRSVALATVVQTWGSAPRGVGAKMALTLEGRIAGSVSGGCVEGAVVAAGLETLRTNKPQLLHFGVADEAAWEVGLACGGSIDVFVKPLDPNFFDALHSALSAESPASTATVIRGTDAMVGREMLLFDRGEVIGMYDHGIGEQALDLARESLTQGVSRRVQLDETTEIFLDALMPSPTLIVVGGVHITIPLVSLAKMLGYRTVVIDPRSAFGNAERFLHVDRLIAGWPQEAFQQIPITGSTAIVMLTHDPKLDDPALKIALPSPAFYVGALGSKTTQAKRRQRLLAAGLTESQLKRLHGPIGVDIAARTPEEIAVAIMAEIVAVHNTKTALRSSGN